MKVNGKFKADSQKLNSKTPERYVGDLTEINECEVPWNNAFWPGLTPFGPPMWQAEADTEKK